LAQPVEERLVAGDFARATRRRFRRDTGRVSVILVRDLSAARPSPMISAA